MKSWGIYIVVFLGYFAYSTVTKVDRDSTGAIVDGGSVGAFDIRVGDCFDDASATDEITSLPAVPCSEPHDNEAFAIFDVAIASYPDEEGMWELAYNSCLERFDSFVGTDYESSTLEIFTMYPTAESWKHDDREVVCAVFDLNDTKLVGSVAGKAL